MDIKVKNIFNSFNKCFKNATWLHEVKNLGAWADSIKRKQILTIQLSMQLSFNTEICKGTQWPWARGYNIGNIGVDFWKILDIIYYFIYYIVRNWVIRNDKHFQNLLWQTIVALFGISKWYQRKQMIKLIICLCRRPMHSVI